MITAGGSGKRMDTSINKIFLKINNKPILYWSLKLFEDSAIIDKIIIVAKKEEFKLIKNIINKYKFKKIVDLVPSGETRPETVFNGLTWLKTKAKPSDLIGVHNAVNIFISPDEIKNVFAAAKKFKGALLAYPAKDTIKIINSDFFIENTPVRSSCWCAQTPQIANLKNLLDSYLDAFDKKIILTDECQALEHFGIKPKIVECSPLNFKITFPQDLLLAQQILKIKSKNE